MSQTSPKKRLLVCCDGTWMNSDTGYVKPTPWNPIGSFQIPSNVTRMSRSFRKQCSDGTLQIIQYIGGVGTGSTLTDMVTGGAFGLGIAENIREAYSFICANYSDGDDIVLIGFSRGAFTARSVAGMISDLGLLTREGMEFFYPIFKDMENWKTPDYKDPFPDLPFRNKPMGLNAEHAYTQMLLERGLTRVNRANGSPITVKAVGVWDTVGSLGIPQISWLAQLGLPHSTVEYRFFDTNLSSLIENAFHAIALDETRSPFSPALWERRAGNTTTVLKQVWFPGSHGNIGGGWLDEGIVNLTFAWMMDQLATVGVEFDADTISRIFTRSAEYYRGHHPMTAGTPSFFSLAPLEQWAVEHIYKNNHPVRSWALSAIQSAGGGNPLYALAGVLPRTPGLYRKVDATNGRSTTEYLEDTGERVHSSVRVRLACGGLGLNDTRRWTAGALTRYWRLERLLDRPIRTPPPPQPPPSGAHSDDDDDENPKAGVGNGDGKKPAAAAASETMPSRWVWVWNGPEEEAPAKRVLAEDELGPYERHLLRLSGGNPNSFEYAEENSGPVTMMEAQAVRRGDYCGLASYVLD